MGSAEKKSLEEGQAPPPEIPQAHLRDFLGALLFFFASLAFVVAALQIPFHFSYWVWYTSPGIYALIIAICLGGCSVTVGYRGIRGWLKTRRTVEPIHWRERFRAWRMGRFLASVAIILVFLVLLGRVPFLVLSVALILVFGTAFREGRFRDGLPAAITAALVVVVFLFMITKIFGIMFP